MGHGLRGPRHPPTHTAAVSKMAICLSLFTATAAGPSAASLLLAVKSKTRALLRNTVRPPRAARAPRPLPAGPASVARPARQRDPAYLLADFILPELCGRQHCIGPRVVAPVVVRDVDGDVDGDVPARPGSARKARARSIRSTRPVYWHFGALLGVAGSRLAAWLPALTACLPALGA